MSDDREDSDLESSSASDAEDCRVFSPSPSPAGISACWTYESSGSTAGAAGRCGFGFGGVVWVGSPHISGGDNVGILGVREGGLDRMPFPLPPSSLVSPPGVILVCCAPPLPMVMVATPLAENWTGSRLYEGRCEVVCSGLVVWLRVSRGVLGVLWVVLTFSLFECVLVAFRCHGDSEKYYSRSGTPRNIILGVGVGEILFSESNSEKYYSRSRTPRNIILGV